MGEGKRAENRGAAGRLRRFPAGRGAGKMGEEKRAENFWSKPVREGNLLLVAASRGLASNGSAAACGAAASLEHCPSPQTEQLKAPKEELTIEVSGEAGRIRGEALDFLRINIDDETPKSGSRMDFGEKRVYFQKKIEAEISSPSLRERK